MQTERIATAVAALVAARRSGQPWTPPTAWADLSTDEAYAIQADVAQAMGWFADAPTAWKAGGAPNVSGAPLPQVLPTPATWSPPSWGVPEEAPGDLPTLATSIATSTWIIEAEVAFRLGRAPDSTHPEADILQCLDTVAVAIEAIDTRLHHGLQQPSAWKLADQGVHGTLVLGPEQAARPVLAWDEATWRQLAWAFTRNGQPESAGHGGLPAITPHSALRWLASHAARHTGGLRAGDVVTTGAWAVVRAERGDTIQASFTGLGDAKLTLA